MKSRFFGSVSIAVILGIVVLIFFALDSIAQEPPRVGTVQYPLKGEWSPIKQDFGRWSGIPSLDYRDTCRGYHLGEDVARDPGVKVYPMTDGIVRFAAYISQNGYTAVIEHNVAGEYVTTVYYHMKRPGMKPEEGGIELTPGQLVHSSDPIGYISGRPEDHGSTIPHLHFGIRKGRYQQGKDSRTGFWYYPGYTTIKFDCNKKNQKHQKILSEWYNPVTDTQNGPGFINSHLAVSSNHAPNTPNNPSPTNGATNVNINVASLSWAGGDPDNDPVIYDIYFGTSSSPPLIKSNHPATSYNAGSLTSSTTYYWKILAKDNKGASAQGPLWSFTTQGVKPLPTVTTTPATNVTTSGATLNGTVNPNGFSTTVYFQWGTSISYGNTTQSQAVGSGSNNVSVSSNLSGLAPSTTYHYRIIAQYNNGAITIYGADVSFTTTASPSPPKLVVFPTRLSCGGSAGTSCGPGSMSIQSDGGPLNWSATVSTDDGHPWLSLSPVSGTTPSSPMSTLTVLPGMSPGTYTGKITFTASGAANSPLIVPATLQVLAPLSSLSNSAFRFEVSGQNIQSLQVNIFSISGQLVFHSEWVENAFRWKLQNNQGQRLANGVYLYVTTVRTLDGRIVKSKVRKLVIMR